jgi:peptidoglycan-associated lipoprotein
MSKMRITIAALAMLSMVACAKKHKPDAEVAANATPPSGISDTDIQGKDLSSSLEATSDSGKINGLYTLNFEYDKSSLNADARSKAAKDAQFLKEHPSQNVQIEGHCDRHGSIEYNLALGERRANTVKKYLVNLGAEGSKLSTISYGKERLIESEENETADAKNRRANFRLVSTPIETHRM